MKLQLSCLVAAALFSLAAAVRGADAPGEQPSAEQLQQAKEMSAGRTFTPEQANAAETRLQANPKDLATRLQLLGYYSPQQKRLDAKEKNELMKHFAPLMLGLIENHPESELAGLSGSYLGEGEAFFTVPEGSPNYYNEGMKLWDKLIAANPTNAQIIGQAAIYRSRNVFQPQEQTIGLLEKACELDPRNPKWPRLVGETYLQQARYRRLTELAGKALAMLERAASLTTNSMALDDYAELTQAAGLAEQWGKVFQYGTNASAQLDRPKRDWNYGNMVHNVNAMLCLAALQNGDKKLAGEYLLRAGRSPGSPQLGSFGPDFSYAAKMLQAGETNVVLQYLDLVGNFWGNTNRSAGKDNSNTSQVDIRNASTLEKYRQEIRAGKMPTEASWRR